MLKTGCDVNAQLVTQFKLLTISLYLSKLCFFPVYQSSQLFITDI